MPFGSRGSSHSREIEVLVVELMVGAGCPTGAVYVCRGGGGQRDLTIYVIQPPTFSFYKQ